MSQDSNARIFRSARIGRSASSRPGFCGRRHAVRVVELPNSALQPAAFIIAWTRAAHRLRGGGVPLGVPHVTRWKWRAGYRDSGLVLRGASRPKFGPRSGQARLPNGNPGFWEPSEPGRSTSLGVASTEGVLPRGRCIAPRRVSPGTRRRVRACAEIVSGLAPIRAGVDRARPRWRAGSSRLVTASSRRLARRRPRPSCFGQRLSRRALPTRSCLGGTSPRCFR